MMKKTLLFLLLFPIYVFSQQREVFRIDSLPKEGILLNQGWKWHTGDNPEWAKADFNDAKWGDIDPTKDIFELPQLPRSGEIGWFRIHLLIDSSITQQLVMLIQQSGASEIYLNGKLIHRFGILSADRQKIIAFTPALKPISFPISNKHVEVLAVRYALQPGVCYSTHFGNLNKALAISLNTIENGVNTYEFKYWTHHQPNPIRTGIFFVLAILYFAFYFFYRKRVVNLYFSIYALLHAISWKINNSFIHGNQVAYFFIQNNATTILQVLGFFVMLNAIYQFLEQKRKWHYWALILLGIISIPIANVIYYWGWMIYGLLFTNLVNLELTRVSIIASRRNKKGAWIIATGSILALFCWLIFSLQSFFPFTIFGIDFFDLNFICVPISVSIYLGYEVSLTNISLAQKLIEVETLSVEKQAILTSQNETLERQVTERTAEISSKNRELEIEAALERVRSRTMAMQHSTELEEVSLLLFEQMKNLGLEYWTSGFCIWRKDNTNLVENWMNFGLIAGFLPPLLLPYHEDDGHRGIYEAYKRGELTFEQKFEGEALTKHYYLMMSLPSARSIFEKVTELGLAPPPVQWKYAAIFKQGYLLFVASDPQPKTLNIATRFAKVFEQTYTRFLDLQKAEAQVKEANKQASLERVRGQIASMRSAEDLQLITPLIWQELTNLEIPFIRCGLFIIDEANAHVQALLAAPDGHSLGSLSLSIEANDLTLRILTHWRQKTIFRQHWNKDEFLEWTQSLFDQGQITDREIFQGAATAPESLDLHFVPFTQGMLYVGSTAPLSQVEAELVHALADEFAIAYARYEDFHQLEKAKQSIEATLHELRATQAQLIQSEKLASLGELTAGIAHEIQNPLNFVNNFSELSVELAEELKEEINKPKLDKGLIEELATDLATNQEKINHHGKRASAIVKGMLEHSRMGDAMHRVSTDINALADEYLRLSYHGLRAKDSSFNATMETHFDPELPKIEVIPQDIGRVLLNLINNAFYAVHQRAVETLHATSLPYQPTVIVTTKKLENAIEISVRDNGNGIPDAIKDKIFQPFFTTKPAGQGTGLGLSLAYDIITKGHGGTLEVDSLEKIGTSFTISLPMTSLKH
jgi:signal transduction histidine kinase